MNNIVPTSAPPLDVEIEFSACCQLMCPFCRTGALRNQYRHRVKRGYMKPSTLQVILDKVPISLAYLYNWGEPLLNPDILELTRMVAGRGIKCELGTNLQFMPQGMEMGLVESGVTSIRVSCDGMTQETYGYYRIGGSLERLIKNAERLAEAKSRCGSATLIVFQTPQAGRAPAPAAPRCGPCGHG